MKILMQTQHILIKKEEIGSTSKSGGGGGGGGGGGRSTTTTSTTTPKYQSLSQSLRRIITEEGMLRLWRGNGVNCIRVVPYSGFQFASYDVSFFFEYF